MSSLLLNGLKNFNCKFCRYICKNFQSMKKAILFLIFIATLSGCKSTSTVNTKLDNKTERMLKGDWIVTSVDFPGSEYLKVNSFNLADSKCFVGSNWNLVSNNNQGTMTLSNPDINCKEFSSPITWYVNEAGNFVLKIINDYKAKNVNAGYVLQLNNVTETSFELIDEINVAGQAKKLTYKFLKK